MSVSPSEVPSPAIGEQLTLSLKIADGENVAGYQGTVQFDTSALRYVESANGDFLPAGAFFVPPVVEGNRVTLASSAINAVSNGDGTLATITFEVVEVKASTITLSEVALVDPDGKLAYPRIENGRSDRTTPTGWRCQRRWRVNIFDLVRVAGHFGQAGDDSTDVNGDGVVNIFDLVLVAGALETHPPHRPYISVSEIPIGIPYSPLPMSKAGSRKRGNWISRMQRCEGGLIVLEQLLAVLTPKETTLLPNYPNPFNPETWIPYHLAYPPMSAFVSTRQMDS